MTERIIYLAFARMPTEKAHGFTIAKSCESFAQAGKQVELWIPKRRTPVEGDLFSAYGLERNFIVREIKVPDIIRFCKGARGAFTVHLLLFLAVAKFKLLFRKRRGVLIYTRDTSALLFACLGYQMVLECHSISQNRGLYFFFARRANRIITISQALKDTFVEAGFQASAILVAPSGVDLSVFDISLSKNDARSQLNLPVDMPLAVYTGNFTTMGEDKGLADIIQALPNTEGITFVAAGGSQQDSDRYLKEASKLGNDDRVIFRGHMRQSMLALYQRAADMLLMPFPDKPHYRKHMSPVKMFEYMSSERPIIASDLPTIREVLNPMNAYIVPPGSPQALAAAMRQIIADQDGAKVRAKRARQDVEQYTWEKRAKRVLAFVV